MLSIQTNVASLVAQQNLNVNNAFQSQTIQQLTSGYRINSSGDDPAGLAVANQIRDNVAQVTQGVANGNDAQAQLQIMDGGISNISQILDTLQTLATESASSSFTGDRTVLNNQFQSDIAEINRQAQSIGLNTGGTFATNLAVYLGGGQGTSSNATLSNGTVNVDLSNSTVDAQSLGLNGVQATNAGASPSTSYDLSSSSTTSVQTILGAANSNPTATSFTFNGPGFGDTSGIAINVNLTGVASTSNLVNNINAAIQSAGQGSTGAAAAFKAANITASMVTNSAGHQQLAFNSSNAAFSVTSGDATASALMGSFLTGGAAGQGNVGGAITEVASGSTELATAGVNGNANTSADLTFNNVAMAGTQNISINAVDASGNQHSLTVNLASGTANLTAALTTINTALQKSDDSTLQQITAVQTGSGTSATMNFVSTLPNFTVNVGADSAGTADGIVTGGTGVGSSVQALQVGTGSTADISTLQGATNAVSAVSNAVLALGIAQAAIGQGENQLNYAVNLASSQITNFSAAESQIRDADVAQQAANLSKAQTLQQASIAAMAQANSAPQAVLALLKT
jgi:flagellin